MGHTIMPMRWVKYLNPKNSRNFILFMMKGILIDCYRKDNKIILWIKHENKNLRVEEEEYYFFEKDLFPLSRVEFELEGSKIKSIKSIDDSEDIDYKLPDFSIAKLMVKTKDNLFKSCLQNAFNFP